MDKKTFKQEIFEKIPIVGIMRNIAQGDIMSLLPIYAEAKLTTVEITMNSAGATDLIRQAVQDYGGVLNIGAGTVCNMEELELALARSEEHTSELQSRE